MEQRFGFLLLTSHLGNPERKPLTGPQLRTLTQRIRLLGLPGEDRELTEADLLSLGYDRQMAQHIYDLLQDTALMKEYLRKAASRRCQPITRQDPRYPLSVRRRLGADSPGCLWAKGDVGVLSCPSISLVGSRDLRPDNLEFAWEVGRQAALQGYTLVSGNARGADQAGQEGCLQNGGQVISVVADALHSYLETPGVLYLSEEDYDLPFSTFRALRRNRVIHSLADAVFVAQSAWERGGTWRGTTQNLSSGWSKVYCFRDGSEASVQLEQMGAALIGFDALRDIPSLMKPERNLFDL